MSRSITIICACLLSFCLSGQFKLENILAAPYSSDLIKSENGLVIAWVTNTKGIRTLSSFNLANDTLVTHFSSMIDNGQVIGGLQLDPAGEWLYFLTGSNSNRKGEAANPSSASKYPIRRLVRVHTLTNKLDTIGMYDSFTIAPGGDYLMLPKGNQLYQYELDSNKVTEIVKMRGTFNDIQIAPDNESITFVSYRGDHSFIGHYKYDAKRIKWIAPGVDFDTEPQFSPDGTRIAFLRSPGHKKGFLRDLTSGNTFQLMVYHLESGDLDTLWSAPNDAGGFAQYYHSNPLRWTKSDHLVFYSEHEGFMNIYSLKPDGSEFSSVAKGSCEVEHSDINTAGNKIIFSANCSDIDRRDLSIYDLNTNIAKQITSSPEIETNPLYLENDRMAYLKGSVSYPTGVFINDGREIRRSNGLNVDFPGTQLVTPTQVIYEAPDGLSIHGQLFDNGRGSGKPAVIFMHGGPIRQMLLGYHYSSYYANAYAFNQYLANRGYVVFSVNYRSGIGYGRDFRRAANQGPRGASEYLDIVEAAKYLQGLPQVDPERIGLWGGSYGGFLTAMGLARNSDIFKAGVDLHGVHDWAWRAKDFSEGGAWGINEKLMPEAWNSSPVSSLDGWTSPVLFIHGDDDRNVMFSQTVDLVQRLREKGIPHELLILPDEVHGFYRWESWFQSFQKAAEFFDRKL